MIIRPEKRFLFAYFIILILTGTILLSLPFSWGGKDPLQFIDALFTSTSAVCVTGLITVDTAQYSHVGKIIILILIQAGGLGIISFTTIYLILPSRRISFQHRKLIKDFFIDSVEADPVAIMKQIIFIMVGIELIGAIMLFIGFYPTQQENAVFSAVFHAISSFCNAGFSIFSNNLENYVHNPIVNVTVIVLVVLGGFGFVVLRDIGKKLARRKKKLVLHTKIVLVTSLSLILIGGILYFSLEFNNAYRDLPVEEKVMAAIFQSVTPRTAGFNTIPETSLTTASQFITMPLMYIGASPGSTGGGIKTSTFFIVLMLILFGSKRQGEVIFSKRRIPASIGLNAAAFMLKILILLVICIVTLLITELVLFPKEDNDFIRIVFECFSAFGTVGLSLGATPDLSVIGKIVIMFLMFEGKVGLISMALTTSESRRSDSNINYPSGEVLIG